MFSVEPRPFRTAPPRAPRETGPGRWDNRTWRVLARALLPLVFTAWAGACSSAGVADQSPDAAASGQASEHPPARLSDDGADGADQSAAGLRPAPGGIEGMRFSVLGDFGNGTIGQQQVADTMIARNAERPFDAVLTVGDNFYPAGLQNVDDAKFADYFLSVYSDLGVTFYPSLGNHDHAGNVNAEIAVTSTTSLWYLPARYHRFALSQRGVIVELFVIDTTALITGDSDPEQRAWLQEKLATPKLGWRVVYGHHPIISDGPHGDTAGLAWLPEVLEANAVDLFLAGHDHILEVLETGSVLNVISGGGGGPEVAYAIDPRPSAQAAATGGGYVELDFEADRLTVVLIDDAGDEIGRISRPRRDPRP